MLSLDDVDLKQTQFYNDVFVEGRDEGEQEGRQKGEVTLILRLLQRRCSELAPALREQVTQLPLPHLEALGEALLDFRGVTDLEHWLARQGSRAEN